MTVGGIILLWRSSPFICLDLITPCTYMAPFTQSDKQVICWIMGLAVYSCILGVYFFKEESQREKVLKCLELLTKIKIYSLHFFRKIFKFHACECVYAHKFNLKYKIYARWNVIVFFWSYVELGMINFWNDKFYFISFFWRSFTLFSIMTCVDLKTESRRLQPNPAIKIISPTPPPWEKLLSPYICDVHFSENENFVQRRALN